MKERPILMSGPMVRAILKGNKTQTRRVIKSQPQLRPGDMLSPTGNHIDTAYWHWKDEWWWQDPQPSMIAQCPYGQPGSMLWVRETWQAQNLAGQWWHEVPKEDRELHNWAVIDKADCEPGLPTPPRWIPGIFMPHWASRITLRVTGVRVERVQDIHIDDIKAEGVYPGLQAAYENWKAASIRNDNYQYLKDFEWLWNSINGKRPGCAWEDNPWVWVIEFERTNL